MLDPVGHTGHFPLKEPAMRTKLAALLIAATCMTPALAVTAVSATPASAATATCHTASVWSKPPRHAITYPAGHAGTVTLARGPGGLKVTAVHRNAGWSAVIDTASGNSVDVYFRRHTSRVKFEAGIEDNALMQRLVTTC
jgi:hypothetical protein